MSKKIRVRASVLKAADTLKEEASFRQRKPHHMAQKIMEECEAGGDDTGVRFWRDVWIHLMLMEYEPGEIQIIEDDHSKPS